MSLEIVILVHVHAIKIFTHYIIAASSQYFLDNLFTKEPFV